MFTMDTLKALHNTMSIYAHFALLKIADTDTHAIAGCGETQRKLFASIEVPADMDSPEHLVIVYTTPAQLYKDYNIVM